LRARALVVALAAGCDATFDVRSQDLGPFRIAAIGTEEGRASAVIWSGLGLYHDDAPSLEWTLDGEALGSGWDVAVPDAGVLGLTATSPEGVVRQAQVRLADPGPALGWQRYAVTLGDDLSIDARAAAEPVAVAQGVAEGEAARVALDNEAGTTARWMVADGRGTLLELDPRTVDLLAEEIEFDDGEVAARTDAGPGRYSLLGLVIDGQGANRWTWIDVDVGATTPAFEHRGRLLDGDADTSTGLVAGTIASAETPAGIALMNLEPVTDTAQQDALACGGAPFRLDWLAAGRCTRPELEGMRVVLEVTPGGE